MKTKITFVSKLLALLLSLMLLFSTFPVAALEAAEEPSVEVESETETEALDTDPEELLEEPTEYQEGQEEEEPANDSEESTEEVLATEDAEQPTETVVAPTEDKKDIASVAAPEGEKPTVPPMNISDGYYLFGPKRNVEFSDDDWKDINNVKANERFSLNTENTDEEEYMLFANLSRGRKIKVVEVKDNKIIRYYPGPDGGENAYTVPAELSDNVVIFFTKTANTKEDWEPFGRHFYISKTLTVKDDEGAETTVNVEEDTEKPTLSVLGYAYKDGDNLVDWDNKSWIDGSKKPYVKVCAKDVGFGINVNSFALYNGSEYSRPAVTAAPTAGEYYLELPDKNAVQIRVSDNAGLCVSPMVRSEPNMKPLKIDDVIPTAEDIVSGVFTKAGTDISSQILNVLSFGLYSNDKLAFTVTVTPNSGSPIKSIVLMDGNDIVPAETDDPQYDSETKKYYRTFILENRNDKPYDLKITEITDEVGNSFKDSVSILKFKQLSAKNPNFKADAPQLFEVVATHLAPNVTYSPVTGESNNDIFTNGVGVSAEISDTLSGIYEKDGNPDISVFFDLFSKFKEKTVTDPDGNTAKVHDGTGAKKVTDFSFSDTTHGSGDLSGKLLSGKLSFNSAEKPDTGKYMALIVVKNNSGLTTYEEQIIHIDNDDPVISEDKVLYQKDDGSYAELNDWTKRPVRVQFKAADAANDFEMGVKPENITVTGSFTGKEAPYTVYAGEDPDTYYFDVDLYQDYTIVVSDDFGHTATLTVEEDRVLFDNDAPKIKNVKYDGVEYADSLWKKKVADGGGVTVSFTVTDYSSKRKNVWLSGKKSITLKVIGEDSYDYADKVSMSFSETDGWTCSFVSDKYQTYSIVATDHAGNDSKEVTTEKTKVDDGAPEITNISFRSVESSVISQLLHFLSFGIYHDKQIVMIVETTDKEVSSGIKEINAYYENKDNPLTPYGDGKITDGDFNEGNQIVATREFILDEDKVYNGQNIFVNSVDVAGYTSGDQSLVALNDLGRVTNDPDHNVNLDLSKYFEIVGSSAVANIDETSLEYKSKGENDPLHSSLTGRWYPGDVIDTYEIKDDVTKIHSLYGELNSNVITENCDDGYSTIKRYDEDGNKLYTVWNSSESSTWVKGLSVTIDTSKEGIAKHLNTTNKDKIGENSIKLRVVSNNGRMSESESTFYVDDTIPVIEGFDFEGYDTDSPTGGAVLKTTYGYYFKNSTDVTVTASDIGSGVNNIHLYGIAATADYGTVDFTDKKVETADKAVFTVPANFKGQLVAYAYDNVNNRSLDYNPDGLIVESEGTHPNVSGANITVNTNPVGKDQDGVKLFSGDVSVTFDIFDMYSGLKDVSYRIIDTAHPNPEFITVNTNDTPVNASYVGDWRIDNINSNLAHRISRTITVSAQEHNDNGVKIQLKGTDRAGFEIPMVEETISIDITKPIIKVEYNPVLSTAASHNGQYYFKTDRTATITITERNFNPDQIDWSKFVALEGSRPAVVGLSNWSTSYALETGSAVSPEQRTAVHTAQITFAEDGKFDVDFDYTDLAGNAADKQFEKETFYIDKTKPVMTVEMKYSASPRYSKDNMATIRIIEHNFDPDAEHLTYSPTATGPDYTGSGITPSIGAWSTSGDEHTATINFPDEGKYTFKLAFKDLALNEANEHNEPEFYVDHTAEKPEFDEKTIRDHFAYDGEVAPAINYHDNSFNASNYSFRLTRHAYDFDKMEQVTENVDYPAAKSISKNSATGLDNGARVDYENFPNQEIADGIYTLYAEYTDLANNQADNTITFSVNRFGSVFLLGSVETTKLVKSEYTNDAPDVVIREISAIQHKANTVSLSYNSSSKTLNEGSKQYKVTSPNTVGSWFEYLYDVFADNFKNEGEYTVTVTSQYSIGGKDKDVSNRTANTDGKVERNCPVSFVVDKTTPSVSISGVEEGKFYSEAEKNLKIVCTDDNIATETLKVRLDGEEINLEEHGATVNDELFGEIDIDLPIAADGKQTEHSIVVEVSDLAGNSADNSVNAFTLSATFLTMFFHNTVALIVTGAVLAALIALGVVLVVKKRKKT